MDDLLLGFEVTMPVCCPGHALATNEISGIESNTAASQQDPRPIIQNAVAAYRAMVESKIRYDKALKYAQDLEATPADIKHMLEVRTALIALGVHQADGDHRLCNIPSSAIGAWRWCGEIPD
jgi:hypothetical protein